MLKKGLILDQQDYEDCAQITMLLSFEEIAEIKRTGRCINCDYLEIFHFKDEEEPFLKWCGLDQCYCDVD